MVKGGGLLSGKSKNYGRDDGCIGNRKVRTVTFSMILIAFMCFGLSYFLDQQDWWSSQNIEILGQDTCPKCIDAGKAWTMVVAGAFTVIASSVCAIILFFVNCDDKLGRAAGVGLVIGGVLYMIGYSWYIGIYHDMYESLNDFLSDDARNRINMMLAAWFGEALLPSAMALLLGLDVFMHIFDDESHRLASNLMTLVIVSFLTGPCYYTLSDDDDDISVADVIGPYPYNSDAYPWIATGYMVLGCFSLSYVVLYICTCCTCDCKDNKLVRLLMALGLIAGGVLAAIGYWIFAGEFTSDNSDEPTNFTLYYVGYTIAVAGFPIMWALDVGVDDLRGN